jgi:hypothetical protein
VLTVHVASPRTLRVSSRASEASSSAGRGGARPLGRCVRAAAMTGQRPPCRASGGGAQHVHGRTAHSRCMRGRRWQLLHARVRACAGHKHGECSGGVPCARRPGENSAAKPAGAARARRFSLHRTSDSPGLTTGAGTPRSGRSTRSTGPPRSPRRPAGGGARALKSAKQAERRREAGAAPGRRPTRGGGERPAGAMAAGPLAVTGRAQRWLARPGDAPRSPQAHHLVESMGFAPATGV